MPSGAVVDNNTSTLSPSSIGGTVPYMAPEQLRGDATDDRTDIFSVGTVLYEMATGFMAFPQHNLAALLDAIEDQHPAPPTMVNPHVPLAVERIIIKAMEKDPAARFQSAAELADSLEALMPVARRATVHTMAGNPWPALAAMGA
jgi:serine/threonine-protein kinase